MEDRRVPLIDNQTETNLLTSALRKGFAFGCCTLLRFLGSGGSGITYFAFNNSDKRYCIVKEIYPASSVDVLRRCPDGSLSFRIGVPDSRRDKVLDDIDILYESELRISNEVRYVHTISGENNDPHFFPVIPLPGAPENTLARYLLIDTTEGFVLDSDRIFDGIGPDPEQRVLFVLSVTERLLDTLGRLHNRNGLLRENRYIHADIKPQNLYLVPGAGNEGFRIVLLDLGSAMLADSSGQIVPEAADWLFSTAYYCAPEFQRAIEKIHDGTCCQNDLSDIGIRSDLFSVVEVMMNLLIRISGKSIPDVPDSLDRAAGPNEYDVMVSPCVSTLPKPVQEQLIGLIHTAMTEEKRFSSSDFESSEKLRDAVYKIVSNICNEGVTSENLLTNSLKKAEEESSYIDSRLLPDVIIDSLKAKEASPEPFSNIIARLSAHGSPDRHLLLTGDGGAGKTTLLYELWRHPLDHIVPLYVPLYAFHGEDSTFIRDRILSFAGHPAGKDMAKRLDDLLDDESGTYQYLILLDGINESSHISSLQDELWLLANKRNVQLVISDRSENLPLNILKDFTVCKACPLDVRSVLKNFGIEDCPDDLTDLLSRPMFLALYLGLPLWEEGTSGHGDYGISARNVRREGELFDVHNRRLIAKRKEDPLRAKYYLSWLFPAFLYKNGSMMFSEAEAKDIFNQVKENLIQYRPVCFDDRQFDDVRVGEMISNYLIPAHLVKRVGEDGHFKVTHSNYYDFYRALYDKNEMDTVPVLPAEYQPDYTGSLPMALSQGVLPEHICQLLGDLYGEYRFKDKIDTISEPSPMESWMAGHCRGLRSENLLKEDAAALTVKNCIDIMRTSRENHISAEYDNLDLSQANFYRCSIPHSCFHNAKLSIDTFGGHGITGQILCFAFSFDDKFIILGHYPCDINIFNLSNNILYTPIHIPNCFIVKISFIPNTLNFIYAAIKDREINSSAPIDQKFIIQAWDIFSNSAGCIFKGFHGFLTSMKISDNSLFLLCGSEQHTFFLWAISTGKLLYTFKAYIAFISNSEIISLYYKEITCWQLVGNPDDSSFEIIKTWSFEITEMPNDYECIGISPDSHFLLFLTGSAKYVYYNIETHNFFNKPKCKWDNILNGILSPDCKYLIGSDKENHIILADSDVHTTIISSHPLINSSDFIQFSHNSKYCAICDFNNNINLFETETAIKINFLFFGCAKTEQVSLSSDNKYALCFRYGFLKKWNMETDHCESTLDWSYENGSIIYVAYSPIGNTYAVCTSLGKIIIFDAVTLKIISINIHKNASCIAYTPDGKSLLSFSNYAYHDACDKKRYAKTSYISCVWNIDTTTYEHPSPEALECSAQIRNYSKRIMNMIERIIENHVPFISGERILGVYFTDSFTCCFAIDIDYNDVLIIYYNINSLDIVSFLIHKKHNYISFSGKDKNFVIGGILDMYDNWNVELYTHIKNNQFVMYPLSEKQPFDLTSISISFNGELFLTGDADGDILLWSTEPVRLLKQFYVLCCNIDGCDFCNTEMSDDLKEILYLNGGIV